MWAHPYIFGIAVVLLIIAIFFAVAAYKDKLYGLPVDLTLSILAFVMSGAYSSMSLLYLASIN